MRGILRGSPRSTPEDAGSPRRGQLALTLQEILTATVRLRANRQVATDAESFRSQIKQLLSGSEQESRALGYASDDIALALYAVVAFLDESVLNSAQPMFSSWPSRPLRRRYSEGTSAGRCFLSTCASCWPGRILRTWLMFWKSSSSAFSSVFKGAIALATEGS